MPWLVGTMRRRKTSDIGMRERRAEELPPDLRAISRAHPLPISPQIPGINGPDQSEAMLAHRRTVGSRGETLYALGHPGLMGPPMANPAVLSDPYLLLQGRQILARDAVPRWDISQYQHYPLLNPLPDPYREARIRQLWAHNDGPPDLRFGMPMPNQQPRSHSWYPPHLPTPDRGGVYNADYEAHLQSS